MKDSLRIVRSCLKGWRIRWRLEVVFQEHESERKRRTQRQFKGHYIRPVVKERDSQFRYFKCNLGSLINELLNLREILQWIAYEQVTCKETNDEKVSVICFVVGFKRKDFMKQETTSSIDWRSLWIPWVIWGLHIKAIESLKNCRLSVCSLFSTASYLLIVYIRMQSDPIFLL